MTPDDIYRAYDGLRPDEDARERMLRNIRAETASFPIQTCRRRRSFRGALLLAAALALVLTFGTVTYATDLFGLRSVILYHQSGNSDEPYSDTDVLSLQGLADSPEAMANTRWQSFYNSYDPDGSILAAAVSSGDTALDSRYDAYPCYTREMADELDALADEYGLELLSSPTLYGSDARYMLPRQMADSLPESGAAYDHQFDGGYCYDCGSFMAEGTFIFGDGQWSCPTSYQFVCSRKGYLSVSYLPIGNADEYTQWEYETACGVTATLAMGPDKALIIVDRPETYLVVNVLNVRYDDAASGEEITMPDTVLETMADAFHFDLVN